LSEEEGIVGVGPEETSILEHGFILLDIGEGQGDALIQVPKCPICSLLGCYFDQPIPPAWNNQGLVPYRSPFVPKTRMHVGFLEGDSICLNNNYPTGIWIAHWTQEDLV